jgi:membrane dipeptidase
MNEEERDAGRDLRVRLFDAHCDAPMKVVDNGADFTRADSLMHVTLPGLEAAGVRVQVFASCAVYPDTPPERVVERGLAMVAAVWEMASASAGRMVVATTAADVRRAMAGGPIAAMIALEGADPLEGKADNLRDLAERGVRSVVFAWKDNEFSGTAFGTNGPLTREGLRLLGFAEELGVIVDVSHLSDRAFADVCRASTRPFIASHSNCRSLCAHPRNLTDAMIRDLADHGGVMGVNLAPHFLSGEAMAAHAALRAEWATKADSPATRAEVAARRRALPRPDLEEVARHVVHAMKVGGEDVVGLGGDLDGVEALPKGVEGVADYLKLAPVFRRAGLSGRQVEKVCHANFARVVEDVLG